MSIVLQQDFYQQRSSLLEKVDKLFQSLVINKSNDCKMINMILNFVGNCVQDANAEVAQKIIEETELIYELGHFYENSRNFETSTLNYVAWIVNNITTKIVKSELTLVE